MIITEAYAAIVALVGQFMDQRSSEKQAEFEEFMGWLAKTNHQEIQRLLELNTKATISIKAIISQDRKVLFEHLERIEKAMSALTGSMNGFGELSEAIGDDDRLLNGFIELIRDREGNHEIIPIVDLCHRGISVKESGPKTVSFYIPYCSGRSAAAFNVNLMPAVFVREGPGYRLLLPFEDHFPPGMALTYETGKSMQFTLDIPGGLIPMLLIAVKGKFTNSKGDKEYPVLDIYKYTSISNEWVRLLGREDVEARGYVESLAFPSR